MPRATAALLALLAGCGPVIQAGSPDSVTVMYEAPGMSAADTAEAAAAHCAQFGRKAVLTGDVHSVPTLKISDNLGQRLALYDCR